MSTTESTTQKTLAESIEEERSCPNGYATCDGPGGDELPCFGCYCESYESDRENEVTDEDCPDCGEALQYGALLDSMTGQRGWACEACDLTYSFVQL